jgi:hypothetical protein
MSGHVPGLGVKLFDIDNQLSIQFQGGFRLEACQAHAQVAGAD